MKIDIRQIEYGSQDHKLMCILRDTILRKPLGLNFNTNKLEEERKDILIGAFIDDHITGCCMLTIIDNERLQLRQMAVINELQKKGIGKQVVQFAEKIAKAKGYSVIIMHARSTALEFYKQLGYHTEGNAFIEVGIPHYIMRKQL